MANTQMEITLHNLQLSYGNTAVLQVPDVQQAGSIIAIVGHNGSGKSTLIKTILGLHQGQTGELLVRDSATKDVLVPERDMAFSPENGAVFEDISVESYVALWRRLKERDRQAYAADYEKFVSLFDLHPLLKKKGRELSKGQRRRVQTVVGYLSAPRLFLFDEPFDGLDVLQTKLLAEIIRNESRRMGTIISSHRMEVVERLADAVIVLHQGAVLSHGSIADVCEELCPRRFLVRAEQIQNVSTLVKRAFPRTLVTTFHEQISVSGREVEEDALVQALEAAAIGSFTVRAARPSLPDAMSFLLQSGEGSEGSQ